MDLRAGIDLFNAGRFWDAHEAWERIWLELEGREKRFVQGLIQLAAAYHHMQRGTWPGAIRLFAAAAEKLGTFPERYANVDRFAAVGAAVTHRERALRGEKIMAGEYPKLGYN